MPINIKNSIYHYCSSRISKHEIDMTNLGLSRGIVQILFELKSNNSSNLNFADLNINSVSCIGHNYFVLDMYFFIREYRATTRNSKNLNVGGTGLTRKNFANINNTHKFIDTLKYYQESLSQLRKTATEEGREAIKKLAV